MSAVTSPSALAEAYARTAPSRVRRSTPRRVARMLVYAAVGFSLGIAACVTAPVLVGHQAFAVLSGSMAPALSTGDVVSFRSPEDADRIVTHRVTAMEAGGGAVRFVTKGDANTGAERWAVATDGTIGRVEYRIPKLGYATNRIGSAAGRLLFLVLPALLLVVTELHRIWRPRRGKRARGQAA